MSRRRVRLRGVNTLLDGVGEGAQQLDAWLKDNLGRPYIAILGIGLVIGIVDTVQGLGAAIGASQNVVGLVATVVFQAALLVNQISQFHDYRQERRQRSEARRGASRSALSPEGDVRTPPADPD